jgi:hypothetical protein
MLGKLLVVALLSQYTRSRVDPADATSQCLWWLEGTVITWHANQDGNGDATPGDTEFTALGSSFATWQAQLTACGNLSFDAGARSASRRVGYFQDGKDENLLVFRKTRCVDTYPRTDPCWANDDCGNVHDCWQFSATALAMTTTTYSSATGRIFDGDIEFNAGSYVLTAVSAPPCVAPNYNSGCVAMDIQNTATHEIGHLLGLAHYPSTASTMNASADPGELSKRILDPGTRQFVCDVYPAGRPSLSCVTPAASGTLGPVAGCTAAGGWLSLAAAALVLMRRRR